MVKKGKYIDYKGNGYIVIGVAKNNDKDEELVIYKNENSEQLLAMDVDLWNSLVFHKGNYVKRFNYVDESNTTPDKPAASIGRETGNKNLVQLYSTINNYLLSVVPKEITTAKLNEYFVSYKCDNFRDLCIQFFITLQDYQFLPNVIGFERPDRRPIFEKILKNYDHKKILAAYDENSLFSEFCNNFAVKNKESKSNSWRRYAASILSVCKYLNKFDNIDEYNNSCDRFKGSKILPEEMKNNIKGMGFALACNLLKDTGFTDYCKPDVHLKDVLSGTGYCNNDDYSVFDCVHDIAEANNVKAMEVDSKIWLACSGTYYKHGVNTTPHKDGLINAIRKSQKQI